MSNKAKRWFASKRSKNAAIIILALALVISILGQVIGWENLGRLITGTAGPGLGGYSCMPTCVENDGRFLSMPGEDMASFGGAKIVLWIEAPVGQSSFEVGIFDGDSGKDNEGNINMWDGNWDDTTTESTYTLYVDAERDGTGATIVGQWKGNTDPMPNNDWFDATVRNVEEARNDNGRYYYRFEATRPIEGSGINAFKVRSTGQLSSGRSEVVDANFAIVGMAATSPDWEILYPEHTEDWSDFGPSTYDGEWTFYFDVPAGSKTISFWDGDFDRGTATDIADDTDDPNTVGRPAWALPSAVDERAGGQGMPADDYGNPLYRREPPAQYEVIGPRGEPIFANVEPSGTEEWEKFVVTMDPEVPDEEVDLRVDSIPAGLYTLRVTGLDLHNTVWFRMNYTIGDDECPECPTCPEPDPTQECVVYPTDTPTPTPTPTPKPPPTECPDPKPVDLLYVLDVSLSMDMDYAGFGSDKKLDAAKKAILDLNELIATKGGSDSRVGLIAYSAHFYGPRSNPSYFEIEPFTTDIAAFNAKVNQLTVVGSTPTAAALQKVNQWLGGAWDRDHLPVVILLTDGVPTVDLENEYYFDNYKVQVVSLYNADGTFRSIDEVRASGEVEHGMNVGVTLADTMQQTLDLKSAWPDVKVHSIAIQAVHGGIFNDGILRYVAAQTGGGFYTAENTDKLKESLKLAYFDSACGEAEPPGGDAGASGAGAGCASPRVNQYDVENPTTWPGNGIRYKFTGGTDIKSGAWDDFKFTLTTEQAQGLSSVPVSAAAGRGFGATTLAGCDFAGAAACSPSSNNWFTFSFQGAEDNGDGTMTLTFRVQNDRRAALSSTRVGLPNGVTPSSPLSEYQSVVCLD